MKIGVDLGGSHVSIGLVDKNNEILEKRTYYIDDREDMSVKNYILSCIKTGIKEILNSSSLTEKDISVIGIATPGNPKSGIIQNVVNLGIDNFDITTSLSIYYENAEVYVANDAKCAALAEKTVGTLKDYSDAVFMCIGTGIGGAVFMHDKILNPKKNSGFEFGHMIIRRDGEKCNCGNNGCLETYCSKRKLKEKLCKLLKIKDYVSAAEIIEQVKVNSNKEIDSLINNYVENLALGIGNLINIFEPEVICIGGSIVHYEELIIERLRRKIEVGAYQFNKKEPPKILVARTGNDAGIIGATLLG